MWVRAGGRQRAAGAFSPHGTRSRRACLADPVGSCHGEPPARPSWQGNAHGAPRITGSGHVLLRFLGLPSRGRVRRLSPTRGPSVPPRLSVPPRPPRLVLSSADGPSLCPSVCRAAGGRAGSLGRFRGLRRVPPTGDSAFAGVARPRRPPLGRARGRHGSSCACGENPDNNKKRDCFSSCEFLAH